jgi:hypothetical protein
MKAISNEAQKKIDAAVKSYPKAWTHGICALQMFNRETGNNCGGAASGYICHAPLNSAKDTSCIVVNAHKEKWHKTNPDFLLWVCRESPFSHGVLNKDNEKELFHHASVFDMGQIGKGGCLWLGKALRYFVEDTWKPGTWDNLRECGLTGLQAFIGASILNRNGQPMGYSHVNLFGYAEPKALRKVYEEFLKIKEITGTDAARTMYGPIVNWGGIAGKVKKVPDGWGGFTEKEEPGNVAEYAELLKEIFEGDLKNVG